MPLVLGIDPGSARTGLAFVDGTNVVGVRAIKLPRGLSTAAVVRQLTPPLELLFEMHQDIDLVVVEGQHHHRTSPAPVADIIRLANIAGAILGIAATRSVSKLAIPEPDQWKGQTKKPINQARTFSHFGISYTKGSSYCWPNGCAVAAAIPGYGSLKRGDWAEVGDALGLARYGTELLRS